MCIAQEQHEGYKAKAPDSSLYIEDLAPTSVAAGTWPTCNYITPWFSMSMEVTTFMLASSLIAGGMNWKQAMLTILLGNLIVIPMLLNVHAGTKYGIPFPVFVRASFAVSGANIPAMSRALVAYGWFGIQSWIGGQSIAAIVNVIWPATLSHPSVIWSSFFGFWTLNMIVIWTGLNSIRFLQSISAPFLLVMSLILLAFMTHKGGGFGLVLRAPSRFPSRSAGLHFFFLALTGIVGNWATLALNIPDFTRFAKSRESQIAGQAFGLPVAMTLYSFIGIACTSAPVVVFGQPIWKPVTLLGRFQQPLLAMVALISILIATLNVNIGANVVGPLNDFSNLEPRFISFRTGGLITGLLGLAVQPWKLLASQTNYIGWLVGYSGVLAPVAGIMVADYLLHRKKTLNFDALYQRGGIYEYAFGFNPRALAALVIGATAAMIVLVVPALRPLYDYASFVGFFVAFPVYVFLMRMQTRTISHA